MNTTIRWAIWGTGAVAQAFVRSLTLVPGTQAVAVLSRKAHTARQFAQLYNIPKFSDDVDEVLSSSNVDVVYIATPNHLHCEHALRAIAAHKGVLVEKPFALNATEAAQIAQAATREHVFCMEAMWMRFMPLVQRARQMLHQDVIGQPLGLTADFALPLAKDTSASAWCPPGGGALLDRGIYCLSLASFLFGDPDTILSSATLTNEGVDATSSYSLRYRSGPVASLWASFVAQGSNRAVIHGSKANLYLGEPFIRPHLLTLKTNRPPTSPIAHGPELPSLPQRIKEHPFAQHIFRRAQAACVTHDKSWIQPVACTGYQYEAIEVVRCIRAGLLESPIMPIAESIRIMQCLDTLRAQWHPICPNLTA